jgi:hypothetical protein
LRSSLLTPQQANIWRRVDGVGVAGSGEILFNETLIQPTIPCLIDPIPAGSRMGGDLQVVIEGIVYIQTHVMFVRGLSPALCVGHAPGDTIVYGGLNYIVAQNLLGAFVDLQAGDKILDESSTEYLCLAVAHYYTVNVNTQARLQIGRAW